MQVSMATVSLSPHKKDSSPKRAMTLVCVSNTRLPPKMNIPPTPIYPPIPSQRNDQPGEQMPHPHIPKHITIPRYKRRCSNKL